jgi:predicted peroxiredoxin
VPHELRILAPVPKLLIVAATGPEDPTRASIPFHIAVNGAHPNGTEVLVILAGDAAGLLKDGVPEQVNGLGIPPLASFLAKCAEARIPIHV